MRSGRGTAAGACCSTANPRRERFHRDFAVQAARQGQELPIGDYDPPALPVPTIDVDTSDDYASQLPEVIALAMQGRSG